MRKYRYYQLLEVGRDVPQADIVRAYRRLAKKYHPDVNHNPESTTKFKKITEAYEILGNHKSRSEYDNSPAECPVCGMHNVLSITGNQYRCRRHDLTFDSSLEEKVCPNCGQKTFVFDSHQKTWICFNEKCAKCGKKFLYVPKKKRSVPPPSEEICPNCRANLFYDTELLFWRCRNPRCRRIYTYKELQQERSNKKESGQSFNQSRNKGKVHRKDKTSPIPKWLLSGLIIFVWLIIGLSVYEMWGEQIIGFFSDIFAP